MKFLREREHRVPGLNTTSTADISFMLLIFFLVTTSMNTDKGLTRLLPAISDTQEKEEVDINRKNTLTLKLTADGRLMEDDKAIPVTDVSKDVVKLIRTAGKKHVIFIESAPQASYGLYFQVQNQLVIAYRRVRNSVSQQRFGQAYRFLSPEEKEKVKAQVPIHISENYDMQEGGRP